MDEGAIDAGAIGMLRKVMRSGNWPTQEKVALTCRILFDAGHGSKQRSHVTLGAPWRESICLE
jgi:hypothetical protein